MIWYKKIIIEKKLAVFVSAALVVVSALVFSFWQFFIGSGFVWVNISPITAPSFFERSFYSALVFISVGALLYWLKFYKYLYRLSVRKLHNKGLYKDTKRLIWGSLIIIVYGVSSKIVDLLNGILSLIYNILNLIFYIFPIWGAAFSILLISVILIKVFKQTN